MLTVKEIIDRQEEARERASVWETVTTFLLPLLPSDAVPRPKNGIKVTGTDRLVRERVLRDVLDEVRGLQDLELRKIETLGDTPVAGEESGKRKPKKS